MKDDKANELAKEESLLIAVEKKGLLRIVPDRLEGLVKNIAVFIGTFYVIGYVLTAYRLNQYSVPTSKFIDAQYFVAGILPGIFLWITIFIAVSAWRHIPHETNGKENEKPKMRKTWKNVRWVFLAVLVIGYALITILGDRFVEFWERLYPFGGFFVIAFGELSLWIFIVLIRNWRICWRELAFMPVVRRIKATRLSNWRKVNRLILSFQMGFIFFILPVVFILAMFYFIAPLSWETYMSIPQAYGGGKPLTVLLYVDEEKVPAELLDADPGADISPPFHTKPLHLVYRTSTEYIVAPVEVEERQGWVIEASAVYALVEESTQLADKPQQPADTLTAE